MIGSIATEADLARFIQQQLGQSAQAVLDRQMQGLLGANLEVFGRVNADGSIAAGSGFTVAKGGTGVYALTWNPAFASAAYVVMLTAGNANLAYAMKESGGSTRTPTAFTAVAFLTTTGAATDGAFDFRAFGPR